MTNDTTDAASTAARTTPVLEICGEVVAVDRSPFMIGRDVDDVIDDDIGATR